MHAYTEATSQNEAELGLSASSAAVGLVVLVLLPGDPLNPQVMFDDLGSSGSHYIRKVNQATGMLSRLLPQLACHFRGLDPHGSADSGGSQLCKVEGVEDATLCHTSRLAHIRAAFPGEVKARCHCSGQ